MVENRGAKPGVRNKFRQVLLVEGQPEILFKDSIRTLVVVTVNDKQYRLGNIGSEIVKLLKQIPGAIVDLEERNIPRATKIVGITGLHIRKSGKNTTLELAAPTEIALMKKIEKVRNILATEDTNITERCSWVCVTDKAHPEEDDVQKEWPESSVYYAVPGNGIESAPEELNLDKKTDGSGEGVFLCNTYTTMPIKAVVLPEDDDDNFDDFTIPPKPAPKKKSEPGRHGPGIPPAKKKPSGDAMRRRITFLREIAKKKEMNGIIPNSPSTDTELHGD